jgi:hypothetical protein
VKTRKNYSMKPLLPDRHPNQDFFVCDILDAVPKDDMASMEHPVFSLSTKPDTRLRRYEHNGNSVQIAPSVLGLATIHDKDILIYCISQLMAKTNEEEPLSRTLRLKAHDLLVSTNREASGNGYKRLKEAFERLAGTRITTDIITNGQRVISGFGLIDAWEIKIKDPLTERMVELEITLSKWMFNAILGREVLTISRDYFRLRKPLERRVYEIVRKHCGQQKGWSISLPVLQKKCGSKGNIREFRRMVRGLAKHDHLPDYRMEFNDETDLVSFFSRENLPSPASDLGEFPVLRPETYGKAKKAAPRYDVYYLEQEWRGYWLDSGKPLLDSPDGAFIQFCKYRHERRPNP